MAARALLRQHVGGRSSPHQRTRFCRAGTLPAAVAEYRIRGTLEAPAAGSGRQRGAAVEAVGQGAVVPESGKVGRPPCPCLMTPSFDN